MPTRTRSNPARSSTSSRSGAKARLDSFAAFCRELEVEDHTPFQLHPFQRTILKDYFEGVVETFIIVPKKNGKTTLLAALALYHLLTTPNAECIMVAASREQAEIILRQARMFIRNSQDLQKVMQPQRREILSTLDEGRIRVLASDEDTADGTIPTLAIVDELHRHKSAALYGVLRDGLTPRKGQIITISTAGSTSDSPLGRVRLRAHSMPGFLRKGTHNYVRAGAFAFHEWCLQPENDTSNMKVVKRANPAPWQTEEALKERHDSGEETPWQFLRFAAGIWTEGVDPWMDPSEWDALAVPNLRIGPKETAWVDVRMMFKRAAIVIAAPRADEIAVQAFLMPESTYEQVETRLRQVHNDYRVELITHGGGGFARSAELLESEGLPISPGDKGKFPSEHPNRPERMAIVSGTLARLVESGKLQHSGDKALRAQVLAGRATKDAKGWRLTEDPETHSPIEALVAMAFAVHVATNAQAPESIYETHGMRFV